MSNRKTIAATLIASAGQGDIAAVEPLLAADFTLEQMVRDADSPSPAGASYDRATYLGFLGVIRAMTRAGMNLTIESMVEEGDQLVVFGTSDAVTPAGWHYHNAYSWHLSFRGDRVVRMREYYDTALASHLAE